MSIGAVCRLFGKSRQALYQLERRRTRSQIDEEVVLQHVRAIRARQPRLGGRKTYELLKAMLHERGIKMGRDKFFAMLGRHKLLVPPRRRRIRTTESMHPYRKYPNSIREHEPWKPEQIWASDITYVSTAKGFVYVSLVTDQYSRKIMGYHVHPTLASEGPLRALQMALRNKRYEDTPLIHHSDRGTQYCSDEYIRHLKQNSILISMSSPGNPYENAIAERVNGILKTEYYLDGYFDSIDQVRMVLRDAVKMYNTMRPHASCDYLTPEQAHHRQGIMKKRWRTYSTNPPDMEIPEEVRFAVEKLVLKH